MIKDRELIRLIYEEVKAVREEISRLDEKITSLEVALIPQEEISEEEAQELKRLSAETRKSGIDWEEIRAKLDL